MTRILLVDDSESLRDYLKQQLISLGAVFLEASDGAAGLRIAQEQKPDLIISDVMMPVMSGIDLLVAVRRLPAISETPMIVLTANEDQCERLAAMPGAHTYVVMKPVPSEELQQLVERALKGS